ncbi:SGNH/GDSL hydrolase family protein [Nocardiopsis potens]|uniref:SGNH/GDSL hydrolase family protein n=1 Tax=Nocardiopsis potens TaxID=1246458 RepID=UPI00034DF554|nr:SGNH/GDSL hydrolase family protein [Nocardiopsis potens]
MATPNTPLTEESDPFCLPPARAAELLAGAPWRRFAVIGDSLSAGTGDSRPGYTTLGWADRVAGALRRARPGAAYLNTGRIGATTADTVAEQMAPALAFRPDLLHLPSGANDLFRREPDFAEVWRGMHRMFALAAESGARLSVFTLGRAFTVPGFPDWAERVQRLNAIVRELADAYGAVLVDMWDHPANSRPDLLSEDRIHFAVPGQALLAAEVVRALAAALPPEAAPRSSSAEEAG